MSRPTTVAVDIRALVGAPTGIGVYTLSLVAALAERRRYGLLGLAHRPAEAAGPLAARGVVLEHQDAPLGILWQQLRLPARLARGDVDLLFSPLATLPLRLPVPAVVTVHDLTPLLYPETHRLKVRLSMLPLLAPSLRAAARVAAVSHATAADLRFHFPDCAGRIEVVHEGVDPEFRPADPEEIAATRRELDCPRGYLLYTGTLEPRKNVHGLLRAWELLRGTDPAAPPLVLVGPYGWGSRALLRRLRELRGDGVHYLGALPRQRLVRVMQAATLFVYPSLYEGFGLPVAEAMACGVPTVASNRSSLPEVVGDAGKLCDPEEPGEIAAALEALLRDPALRRELGARGRERARRFSWAAAAARMEELFAAALG